DAGGVHQVLPLPGGQPHHHDPLAFLGGEVPPEGAVEVVAVLRALALVDLHLGDLAEVADHGEGHVRQRQAHELAGPGQAAVPLGGQHAGGGQGAGDGVPGGEEVVERHAQVHRAGGPGEAGGRVDRVVDGARAVVVADDVDHDEVGPPGRQAVVVEPARGREVGEEQAAL